MKKWSLGLLVAMISVTGMAQQKVKSGEKSLLWKISGNGLQRPSYLFGTIHLICKKDAFISDSLEKIISNCDQVYFEVDLDNLFEMMGAMSKMKMRNDTTLADLLSKEDYEKVKNYIETKNESILPFSTLEKYKPLLITSVILEQNPSCDEPVVMEE